LSESLTHKRTDIDLTWFWRVRRARSNSQMNIAREVPLLGIEAASPEQSR
jgi:hypothetical protein